MDINKVLPKKPKTNLQKVARKLLILKGKWISTSELSKVSPNATARARELRSQGIAVECLSSRSLKKKGEVRYWYRINPDTITSSQISKIFA